VTVGTSEQLDVTELTGEQPRWCGPAPVGPVECLAQVRAHGEPVDAVAVLQDDVLTVSLRRPLRGVAPGQAVVLYDGDDVLGSATITATRR
jgi:tRNA-specific 2-thiouridylase